MKKKRSFLSGLVVFVLITIILGGVGYLGFNIIKNANGGMTGMNMASETASTDNTSTETANTDTSSEATDTDTDASTAKQSTYKINQISQVMINKQALDKAYETLSTALEQMTLDPYAPEVGSSMNDMDSSMSNMNSSMSDTDQKDTTQEAQPSTTVNIYNADATVQQTDQMQMQMQSIGTTYDADKMQQLHSGLYKVSVGMQLLKQLREEVTIQIEEASVDTSSEPEYYISQYYKTIQNRNKLTNAFTYINEAVDFININPYIDANGLVYDTKRMTHLHDSLYLVAQGIADLNKLSDYLLTQSVNLGSMAQEAYNNAQVENQTNSDSTITTMAMNSGTGINVSNIISIVLIAFVVIFIVGLIGSILNLFRSNNQKDSNNHPI